LLDTAEGQAFRDALADRSNDLFLLVIAQTGTVLWPCPPGHENATKRFAATVNEHAREAKKATEERDGIAHKAEDDLDRTVRDRSSIEAAEGELTRVEADPGLLGAIDEARQRLHQARADTPELNRARQKVLELAGRLVAPPEGLQSDKEA
jgi:acyl-CoA reductase-like NAD-dependent aldehyde dehydrogenase